MTTALVGADLDLAADVRGNRAPQVAFDLVVRVHEITQRDELLVGEVLHADVTTDPSGCQGFGGTGLADAVDVGECNFQTLLARKVNTLEACHVAVTFRFIRRRLFRGRSTRRCVA